MNPEQEEMQVYYRSLDGMKTMAWIKQRPITATGQEIYIGVNEMNDGVVMVKQGDEWRETE